jgi:hypothetical protein
MGAIARRLDRIEATLPLFTDEQLRRIVEAVANDHRLPVERVWAEAEAVQREWRARYGPRPTSRQIAADVAAQTGESVDEVLERLDREAEQVLGAHRRVADADLASV